MKNLKDIICEKLIINSKISNGHESKSYKEFTETIQNYFEINGKEWVDKIYNALCMSPIESVEKHKFRLLNKEYDKGNFSLFSLTEDLVNDKLNKETRNKVFRRLYENNIYGFAIYYNKDVILDRDDAPDEHYFIFIDKNEKKYLIYQVE